MNPNNPDVSVGFAADLSGLRDGFSQASREIQGGMGGLSGSATVMGAVIGVTSGVVQELTERLVDHLAAAIKEALTKFSELTKEIEGFRAATGMSIEESSVMVDALGDIGVSASTYEGIVSRTARALRTKEEAFERLGVKVRDTSGAYLPMNEIIKNGLDTLMEYKEGTDRNAASMELFRMNWKQLEPLLRVNEELLASNKEQAEQFGMVISQNDVEAMHALQLATADAKKPLEGMYVTIGRALNPIMIECAGIIQSVLTGAFYVVTGVVRGFVSFLEYLQNGLYVVSESVIGMGRVIGSVFEAIWNAMTSKSPAAAFGAIRQGMKQVEADAKLTLDNIVKHTEETNKRIANMWGVGEATPPRKSGDKEYQTKERETSSPDRAAAEYMKQLQEEWAVKKLIFETNNNLLKLSKGQEADYWESAIQYMEKIGNSEKELHQIRQKVKVLRLEQIREEMAEQQRLDKIKEDSNLKAGQDVIAAKKIELDHLVSLGVVSKQEELQRLRAFEEEAHLIQLESQRRQAELVRNKPVEYAQALARIEDLERNHALKMRQMVLKEKQEELRIWGDLFNGIVNSFKNVAVGLATGTLTIKKAMTSLVNGIAGEFISMGAKIAADWLKKQIMMTFFSETQSAERVAIAAGEALAVAASQGAANSMLISSYAGVAGAAGVSSAAAIPYYGWMIAPEAGMMDYSAAMAFQGMSLMSAEGGAWQIPRDQLALVHKDESILPAHIAEPLRRTVEAGGSVGGDTNIYISAMDSTDVRNFFKRNAANLGPGIARMSRLFVPVGGR